MSTSLVLELQRDALDESVPVSSLLRKAIAVASKLGIRDADEWLTAELNGYSKGMAVPEYRMVFAEHKAKNPMGWLMPVYTTDGKQERPRVPVREPLASVENLTKNAKGEPILPMPPVKNDGITFESFLALNQSGLHSIKDRVRTSVLQWALDLERKGICGEGLTFNLQEREAAKTVQNITVFTGQVTGGAVVQNVEDGTANASQGVHLAELAELVLAIRERLPGLGLEGTQATEASAALKRLEEAAKEKAPAKGKLLAGLAVLAEVFKTAKGAAELQKPIHDLIDWVSRLMS